MQELNYKPNNLARGLQGKSAKLVGLIFPNISNIFYAELIERLEDELFKQGYKTIICNSEHDPNKERDYLEMLAANQCDGIISSSHNLGIEDYEKVEAPILSLIHISRHQETVEYEAHVYCPDHPYDQNHRHGKWCR